MDSEIRIIEMMLEREREIAEIQRRRLARHGIATARRSWWSWRKPRPARQPAPRQISEPA